MYEPVETTTTWADVEDVLADNDAPALEALAPAKELPDDEAAEEPPEPVDPDEAEPDTCCPTVRLTAATVPLMVDARVASFSEF